MSTTCPNNSTECLLRAIISNTDQGYNWNPLNFAFTAALSILAFVIAVIGLLQALVSAGPGRLKASLGALGPVYSDKAKTRFDRTELRFRTVADVPVINIDKILDFYEDESPSEDETASRLRSQPLVHPVAGWALLLQELFLTDVPFKTVPNLTDYLPSDILAAPALASVESLLVLGIMRGCDQFRENQDGWITALGPSRQIDFVVHSGLGPIGTYRNFTYAERTLAYDHNEICGMIYECLGLLRFNNKVVFEPVFRPSMDMECRLFWHVFEDILNNALSACSHQHARCTTWKRQVKSRDCRGLFSRDTYNDRDVFIMTTLMLADTPWLVKAFPSNGIQLHRLVSGVKNESFSWLWEAPLKYELETLLGGSKVTIIAERYLTFKQFDRGQMGHTSWAWYCGMKVSGSAARPILRPAKGLVELQGSNESLEWKGESGDMRIIDNALSHALGWLAESDHFLRLSDFEARRARYWLRFQLAEIDWWLAEHARMDGLCAVANIAYHTPFVLKNEADLTTDDKGARPTYIRCKAKFLLPETLEHFQLPWEWDPQDPSYILIKQYIDQGLQEELFQHTANIIMQRRNATTAWKSNWSFHTGSALSGGGKFTIRDAISFYPSHAREDLSARDLSGRVQEDQTAIRTYDVRDWNENNVPARNESPPPPSPPSSTWSGPRRNRSSRSSSIARLKRNDTATNSTVTSRHKSECAAGVNSGSARSSHEIIRSRADSTRRPARLYLLELAKETALPQSLGLSSYNADNEFISKDDRHWTQDSVSLEVLSRTVHVIVHTFKGQTYCTHEIHKGALPLDDIHLLSTRNKDLFDRYEHRQGRQRPPPDVIIEHHISAALSNPSSKHSTKSQHSRPSTQGSVRNAPDPRMKAMETLLFFRAVLFAALLASASDSTVLLKSEKRKQVVQVL